MATYTLSLGFNWDAAPLKEDSEYYPLQFGLSDDQDQASFFVFELGDYFRVLVYKLDASNAEPVDVSFKLTTIGGGLATKTLDPELPLAKTPIPLDPANPPPFPGGVYSCWSPEVDSAFVVVGQVELSVTVVARNGLEFRTFVMDPEMWVEGGG